MPGLLLVEQQTDDPRWRRCRVAPLAARLLRIEQRIVELRR
jgi:hypothetical protein